MTKTIFNYKIERKKHLVDATDQVLGRLATKIATLLMGKHKASYTPNVDNGDFVEIINAAKVKITGKKLEQKKFYNHSGYPGGLKTQKMGQKFSSDPGYVIKRTVYRMLPKNKLRESFYKRLTFKK
ncbi:MAG: 50S ribosomal protein L13 [Candidatus Parcubacteria bacterium]|nr:50S ribosomal protein L13 [Candidatus Parcubacteria bacterium]